MIHWSKDILAYSATDVIVTNDNVFLLIYSLLLVIREKFKFTVFNCT